MKTICYCSSAFEAHLIKGRLESEGIQSFVINENIAVTLPLSPVIQSMSVQVMVDEHDFNTAKTLLNNDIQEDDSPQTTCPECGSPEIAYGFWGSKTWGKRLLSLLLFPFMASSGGMIGNLRNNYYCKKCRREFKY